MVWDSGCGFGVWGLGFGAWGLEFGVWSLEFGVRDLGLRFVVDVLWGQVQGSGLFIMGMQDTPPVTGINRCLKRCVLKRTCANTHFAHLERWYCIRGVT